MQAVIFCAGKSTRTYPLTVNKPKPLLKAANTTILEHNLKQLSGIIDEAVIVISKGNTLIKNTIGSIFEKIKINYAVQTVANGTGGALLSAKPFLKSRFIVMNGDDFFSRKDIEKCIKHPYSILVKEVDDLTRFGEVVVIDGKATGFIEKPKIKKAGLANCGLYVFSEDIFKHELKKSERGELEVVDYIKYLIKENKEVKVEKVSDYWLPISYPWNLLDANEFLLSKIKSKNKGTIEKGAIVKGSVVVGKGTVIKSGSYLEGPIIIGEGCSIGPNCYVRKNTTIGNNSKIGNAVEVKNSIIGDHSTIGHLSYIGDSVIGDNVNFGAGTITANLRHDDKNVLSPVKGDLVDSGRRKLGAIIGDSVHTGIHTSIYPGRKIWPKKTTMPGEIVIKDII
jgi:bifunctional UDP-N-acetylglucosamine pyrophosphorylase/glucosamine-1-phosphate N-acetyltransferase